MEVLDEPKREVPHLEEPGSILRCPPILKVCTDKYKPPPGWCPPVVGVPCPPAVCKDLGTDQPDIPGALADALLLANLSEALLACGNPFYKVCARFDRIGPICAAYGPLIDALEFKEQERTKTVDALQARIEVLEQRLGK